MIYRPFPSFSVPLGYPWHWWSSGVKGQHGQYLRRYTPPSPNLIRHKLAYCDGGDRPPVWNVRSMPEHRLVVLNRALCNACVTGFSLNRVCLLVTQHFYTVFPTTTHRGWYHYHAITLHSDYICYLFLPICTYFIYLEYLFTLYSIVAALCVFVCVLLLVCTCVQ